MMPARLPLAAVLLVPLALSLACGAPLLGAPEDSPQEPQAPLETQAAAPDEPQEDEPAPPLATQTQPAAQPTQAVDPLSSAITESRWVVVDYPLGIKVGDSELIDLTFTTDGEVLAATASLEGREIDLEPVEIPDVYETHNVVAVASLLAAGLQVEPAGEIAEPLRPGRDANFRWSLSAEETGEHRLALSLRLRFLPKAGGDAVEATFWAGDYAVSARSVFGLTAPQATWIGSLGSVVGTILGFPFLKEFLNWLRGRSAPQSPSSS